MTRAYFSPFASFTSSRPLASISLMRFGNAVRTRLRARQEASSLRSGSIRVLQHGAVAAGSLIDDRAHRANPELSA